MWAKDLPIPGRVGAAVCATSRVAIVVERVSVWRDDAGRGSLSTPASSPVVAFAIHGALVIGTDGGDWLSLGSGEQLTALGPTGPVSAAVRDASGTLTVASWEPRLAQLRDGAWVSIALAAPAVALAVTPRGLVLADAGGGLALLAGGSRTPVQELTADEPVLELVPGGAGIVALLASGAVATTAWPQADAPAVLAHVDTTAVGRVHALFAGVAGGTVLVAGARGCGVLDRGRLVAVASDLGDRIAGAAVFHGHGRALLHTDEGEGCVVDDRLSRTARIAVGVIAGCTPGDGGSVLAWTTSGGLHAIAHDGTHRTLADGGVVLAAPEVGRVGAIAIRWAPASGVRVTRGHVAWT